MNSPSLHPLARDYLKRLKRAAAILPRSRRAELIGEIEAHLVEALPAAASDTEVLNVLERLGEPEQIVAEAASGLGQTSEPSAGKSESWAIPLLLFGGFLVIGWIVGAGLLWSSRVWTLRDKLIGTFLLPGGLVPAALFFSAPTEVCTSSQPCSSHSATFTVLMIIVAVMLVALPVFTAIFLAKRANRQLLPA
jgi:uncharacterized membrane protein